MSEDTRNQTRAIMYLACATKGSPVRDCVKCPNRDDCKIFKEDVKDRLKKGGFVSE